MKMIYRWLSVLAFGMTSLAACAQNLEPEQILKPAPDSWPTYSGDYSSRRYSALTQVNRTNVKNLSLAFIGRVQAGPQGPAGTPPVQIGGPGGSNFNTPPRIVGGI